MSEETMVEVVQVVLTFRLSMPSMRLTHVSVPRG
jgi:hypothetical protein